MWGRGKRVHRVHCCCQLKKLHSNCFNCHSFSLFHILGCSSHSNCDLLSVPCIMVRYLVSAVTKQKFGKGKINDFADRQFFFHLDPDPHSNTGTHMSIAKTEIKKSASLKTV